MDAGSDSRLRSSSRDRAEITRWRKYAAYRYLEIYTNLSSYQLMERKSAILVVCLLLMVSGCRKKEAFEPSRLFGKTYSGQSLQTVERQLELRAGDWNVLEDQRSLSGQAEPPSRLYIISKPAFRAYDTDGELTLTFFNDELVGTRFYASSIDKACAAVEAQQSIGLCSGGDARIEPSTHVWIGKDQSNRSYIGWIDKQRQAVLDNWNAAHPK